MKQLGSYGGFGSSETYLEAYSDYYVNKSSIKAAAPPARSS